MQPRMVILGTGTCQLQEHRQASSILLELENLRLVFDFGRGVAGRLTDLGLRQDDIEHIVLSHYHPDHVSDLIPFLHAAAWSQIDPRQRDLHIYGPAGLEAQLERILNLFGPETLKRPHFEILLHEIHAGETQIGGYPFEFASLPPAGNHGMKFRFRQKSYAFTGDSSYHQHEVAFLHHVDLAVIDAGHLEEKEILELAVRSGAGQIICSHLYRELDEEALNHAAQQSGYRGRLQIGHDLMTFQL